jgi:gamma-tubulin complex component 2
VKHYFFVDQGDFLVHFMDTARDELAKRPSAMSMEKLQVRTLYPLVSCLC